MIKSGDVLFLSFFGEEVRDLKPSIATNLDMLPYLELGFLYILTL